MGVAPHQDDVEHAVVEREFRLLGDDGDTASQRTADHARDVGTVQRDAMVQSLQQSGEYLEKRRLARPVRAEHAHQAARRYRHRDAVQDGSGVVAERDVFGGQHARLP